MRLRMHQLTKMVAFTKAAVPPPCCTVNLQQIWWFDLATLDFHSVKYVTLSYFNSNTYWRGCFWFFNILQARENVFELVPDQTIFIFITMHHCPFLFQFAWFWPKTWSGPVRASVYDIPGLLLNVALGGLWICFKVR